MGVNSELRIFPTGRRETGLCRKNLDSDGRVDGLAEWKRVGRSCATPGQVSTRMGNRLKVA